jgi:hypothetical protein
MRHVDGDATLLQLNVVHVGARLTGKLAVVHSVHPGQRQTILRQGSRLIKAHNFDLSRHLKQVEDAAENGDEGRKRVSFFARKRTQTRRCIRQRTLTRGGLMQKISFFLRRMRAYIVPMVIAAGSAGGTT